MSNSPYDSGVVPSIEKDTTTTSGSAQSTVGNATFAVANSEVFSPLSTASLLSNS
jgi:hypothetical protein